MSINESKYLLPINNNFDLIRLISAFLVLVHHSSSILYGKPVEFDPFHWLIGMNMGNLGVKVFFIISGFLIAKSWEHKKSIIDFALSRVLRIFPAAIVVVLLSTLLLGFISTLSYKEFITHPTTLQYFQNCSIYRVYHFLPGVFESNPISGVNGSLWSLPYEFTCYLFIGIAGLIGLIKHKITSVICLGISLIGLIFFTPEINKIVIPVLGIDFKTFYPHFLFFFSGMIYYQFRDKLKFNLWILVFALTLMIVARHLPFLSYSIKVITLPYLILFFAFKKKIKPTFLTKQIDLSYGLYLYAFPIQQLIVYYFVNKLNLPTFIIISTITTLPFAYFSWRFIEKPMMSLKKRI